MQRQTRKLKMKDVCVKIPEPLYEFLAKESENQGISIALFLTNLLKDWIGEAESEEFFRFLMGEALIKAEYYRSLMKPFERKYSTYFLDFKKQIDSSKQEDFQAWDDLIEWEAYFRAHEEWTKKYEEIKNVWSNNRDS